VETLKKAIFLLVMAVILSGCAVKVMYRVTEQVPGKGLLISHEVNYERPIFVGQSIGELSFTRDVIGSPTIKLTGQKSEATNLAESAARVAESAAAITKTGFQK